MKKVLVVLIGVLMAVMFAAESYAATEVGGTIDVRGRLRDNNSDLNSNINQSTAFWQEKVNLWVDAKIAEGLKGYVELQTGGPTSSKGWMYWGTSRTTSTSNLCTRGTGADVSITTGECANTSTISDGTDSAPNSSFNENRSLGFMAIRYAYIDFMIPGTPVGIKIGHMPIVVGHSIWANTSIWGSDGLMIYAVPIKELMIALGTIKGYETASNSVRSDLDMYGLHALYTFIPKNSAGLNINYLVKNGKGDISTGNAGQYDMAFWNLMLTADGTLDFGLGYKFEFDYQTGTYADYAASTLDDISVSGVALLLGADFKIADIIKIGVDAAYGSGDHCENWSGGIGSTCSAANANGTGSSGGSGKTNEGYINFNDYGYTMIYEDIIGQKTAAGTLGTTSGRATDFGIYNTIYAKLGIDITPIKDMSIGLNYFYLQAVEANIRGQKNDIGNEFDLAFSYNIYKNLKWTFLAGYFIPGGHYEKLTVDTNYALETERNKTTEAAYAFEQKLSLKF